MLSAASPGGGDPTEQRPEGFCAGWAVCGRTGQGSGGVQGEAGRRWKTAENLGTSEQGQSLVGRAPWGDRTGQNAGLVPRAVCLPGSDQRPVAGRRRPAAGGPTPLVPARPRFSARPDRDASYAGMHDKGTHATALPHPEAFPLAETCPPCVRDGNDPAHPAPLPSPRSRRPRALAVPARLRAARAHRLLRDAGPRTRRGPPSALRRRPAGAPRGGPGAGRFDPLTSGYVNAARALPMWSPQTSSHAAYSWFSYE